MKNKQKRLIGVVIVNYNRKELLEKCLQSLEHTRSCQYVIFVIDNGSTDGSIALAHEKFPHITVIEMGYNAGFCKANNVGIQKAIDYGCDVIVLLNNDTEVEPDFLIEIVRPLDMEKKIGMIAPKILLYATKNTFDSAGLVITKDGLAINRLLEQPSNAGNEACEVFCPTGAAAAFCTEVLQDIQQDGMYFDEDYAYYLEDLDMGWRARLRGWVCVYNPRSVVYHHKNATSGGYSKFIAFYTNRNLFYNIIKNYPGVYCIRALWYSIVRYPYLLFLSLMRKGIVSRFYNNIGLMDIVTVTSRGFWDVMKNMPVLCKKRYYIQKRRVARSSGGWFDDFGVGFFESKK